MRSAGMSHSRQAVSVTGERLSLCSDRAEGQTGRMSYFSAHSAAYPRDGYGWQGAMRAGSHLPAPVTLPAPTGQVPSARPSPTGQGNGPGSSGWPASLRKYVERAFASTKEGPERERLQKRLKEIITEAQERGVLWTKDWDSTPLPSALIGPEQSSGSSEGQPQRYQQSAAIRRESPISRPHKRAYSPEPGPSKSTKKALKKKSAAAKHVALPFEPRNQVREQARLRRFGDGTAKGANAAGSDYMESVETDSFYGTVVRGTCQNLEKGYFRLTAKPDAATVRPGPVLQQALDRLVALLRQGKVSYFYAADQFKGMRQDCTVQHIRNALSARIYEAHARSALENGDIGEYNQCQGQLLQHYEAGIHGCRDEFNAYRVLYHTVHASKNNKAALLTCLQSLSAQERSAEETKHALLTRKAISACDYAQFSKLYRSAPYSSGALLDIILPRFRFAMLKVLVKAYVPTLPITKAALRLGFYRMPDSATAPSGQDPPFASPAAKQVPMPGSTKVNFLGKYYPKAELKDGVEDCKQYLLQHGAVLTTPAGRPGELCLDCKASAKQLHEAPAVPSEPQGPALALDDFLTKASIVVR